MEAVLAIDLGGTKLTTAVVDATGRILYRKKLAVERGDVRMCVEQLTEAVRDAIALGLPYTGVSVHSVTADVDAGPVIAREVVTIEETDDESSLYRRIKSVEHRLLVHAVQTVLFPVLAGGVYA